MNKKLGNVREEEYLFPTPSFCEKGWVYYWPLSIPLTYITTEELEVFGNFGKENESGSAQLHPFFFFFYMKTERGVSCCFQFCSFWKLCPCEKVDILLVLFLWSQYSKLSLPGWKVKNAGLERSNSITLQCLGQ